MAFPDYECPKSFLARKLVPGLSRLVLLKEVAENTKKLLLLINNYVALLPVVDQESQIILETDYYWNNKNWIGRLSFENQSFSLRSVLFEFMGNPPELCCQWMHDALKVSEDSKLEIYDPAHVWLWADYFSKFVSSCVDIKSSAHGDLKISYGITEGALGVDDGKLYSY